MLLLLSTLVKISRSTGLICRELNCWTAGITKKHRKIYERTYPTVLVLPDGSSVNVDYHEPKKIVALPLDLSLLTEAEKKARLEARKPKTRVKLVEDIEDDYDENRYLKFVKR
ncbi:39S ribosomal protein L55, mitochondrial [Venturia canescens]|uniref:39S ribosomal protein L55, mitochondrial n=1 Tax=Venturia canescens TaxID=32260 RepID=UPI001C9C4073|nr:39S ribosomal protein L55, mitochondrial [Venturia canescens]